MNIHAAQPKWDGIDVAENVVHFDGAAAVLCVWGIGVPFISLFVASCVDNRDS